MARMNDRGQILLVGAITIAVTFISLGIVLNGSLHTPSLAAEASDDVTGTELEEVRNSVYRETTGLIQYANNNYGSFAVSTQAWVQENVSQLGDHMELYSARKDVALSVGSPTVRDGRFISKTITDTTGSISQYSDTEARHFNVSSINLGSSDTVTVTFNDGGSTYAVEIDDSEIDLDPTTAGQTCPHGGRVEITNATTDAGPCRHLEFVEDLSAEYDIEVSHSVSSGSSLTYGFIGRDLSRGSAQIYGVTVPLEFHSPAVTFVDDLTIAPGEP